MMLEASNVYVVDDDQAVLHSVKAVLDRHAFRVQCYPSAEEFLSDHEVDQPGCLVTDVRMPGMDGIALQRHLLEMRSCLSVVVVTGAADVPSAVQVMRNGAVTLLQKPYQPSELFAAVKQGLESSVSRWSQAQRELAVQQRLAQLTEEERHVLEHLIAGHPNKLIIRELSMSARTVDRRRQSVLQKMGVNSPAELALLLRHRIDVAGHVGTSSR